MTFIPRPSRLATAALLLLAGFSLRSQDSVFMQHPTIKGESTDKNHASWINLQSLSGCISSTSKSLPAACDINISKDVDQSTTFVYSSLLTGKGTGSGKVLIDVCKPIGGGSQLCYYKLELGNARFTSAQAGSSGGGSGVSESWSIAFDSIKWTYTSVNPSTGNPNPPVSQCWDFVLGTAACP